MKPGRFTRRNGKKDSKTESVVRGSLFMVGSVQREKKKAGSGREKRAHPANPRGSGCQGFQKMLQSKVPRDSVHNKYDIVNEGDAET